MASNVTKVKTIRIKNETAAYFEDKPLNKYVDSLYEHVVGGDVELLEDSISVHTTKTEESNEISSELVAEIRGMTGFFDMSVEDFLHQVCERLNEGYVSIEGGKVVTYDSSGINLERFKEVCHEKNIDVQKGMEKCVQMLMRG